MNLQKRVLLGFSTIALGAALLGSLSPQAQAQANTFVPVLDADLLGGAIFPPDTGSYNCMAVPVYVRLTQAEHKKVPGTTRDRSAIANLCGNSHSEVALATDGEDLIVWRAKKNISIKKSCLSTLCAGDSVSFYNDGVRHVGTAVALYANGKVKIQFRDGGQLFDVWRDFDDVAEEASEGNVCRGRPGHSQMCP